MEYFYQIIFDKMRKFLPGNWEKMLYIACYTDDSYSMHLSILDSTGKVMSGYSMDDGDTLDAIWGEIDDELYDAWKDCEQKWSSMLLCVDSCGEMICEYIYDSLPDNELEFIDIQILDEKVKPFKSLTGADGKPLNLAAYMKEHVYMYSSAPIRAKITLERRFVDDVIDLFGKDVRFVELPDGRVQATVRANRESVILFAKSFIPWVTVNEPEDVRTEIKKTIEEGLKIYT